MDGDTTTAMPVTTDRRSFVGGSDIGKIIGVSPYGDAYSLYLEKTGEIEPPEIETSVQRRGKLFEEPIAQIYAAERGARVEPGAVVSLAAADHYRAQIDRFEKVSSGLLSIPIEIKSASEFTRGTWGRDGTDEAPTAYCAQLHWQMIGSNAPFGRIVALLGADDLRVYTIERDPKVDEFLLAHAAEFWSRVQERRPPDIDFAHPSVGDTLARLYRDPKATEILQATSDLRAWRDVLVDAQQRAKEYTAVIDGAKAHLLAAMGNASIINFGDQLYERKTVRRKGYTVADTSYITAALKNAPAGAKAGLPALTEEITA